VRKIDYKKEWSHLYQASVKEVVLGVPTMSYLMVDGSGDPNTSLTSAAVEALFSLSYALKFLVKKGMRDRLRVMPLEGCGG